MSDIKLLLSRNIYQSSCLCSFSLQDKRGFILSYSIEYILKTCRSEPIQNDILLWRDGDLSRH